MGALPRFTVSIVAALLALPCGARAQAADSSASRSDGRSGALVGWQRARAVERHGITWHFDCDCVTGAFANGDPWVIGPVRIVGIDPPCVERGGRVVNGAMIDPDASSLEQGYDSALFGPHDSHYRPERNVALAIATKGPLVLQPGTSLVAVGSRDEDAVVPSLRTAAVLTCLEAVPAPDALRPPYVRGDKQVRWRAADLDYRVLARLPPLPGTPSIEGAARAFDRLWLDHFPSDAGRYAHPLDNMPDHSRDLAALVGTGALLLQLDVPNEDKRNLYVRMVQLGIDLHGCLRGGCRWPGVGAQGGGRKLPILLAGLALGDPRKLAIGREMSAARFAEDSQTFFVRETSPGVWNRGFGGYTKEHRGLPEWGYAHDADPARDDVRWYLAPRRSAAPVNGWVGEALAARLLGLQPAWNHAAFFDFMDRYMGLEAVPDWRRAWVDWHAMMWDAYPSKT